MIEQIKFKLFKYLLKNVTRIEVISDSGREYVKYGCTNVEPSIQDDGKTLKLFFNKKY